MNPIVMIWTCAFMLVAPFRTFTQLTFCDTSIAGIEVNMSLASNCRLDLHPQYLTSNYNPAYDYEIMVMDEDDEPLEMPVTALHIGQQLKVMLMSNACPDLGVAWSFVNIEDKVAPILTCPDTLIECVDFFFYEPIVEIHDCQPLTLDILHESIEELCVDSLSSKVTRTYAVMDGSGNADTCTQMFTIKRMDLYNDVEFPPSEITIAWEVLDQFTDPDGTLIDPPLDLPIGSGAILALYPFGVPTSSGAPLNGHNFFACGVRAYHEDWDPSFDGCKTSFWREWTVYEWHCTEELSRSMLQKVTVIDTVPPEFYFSKDTVYFYMDPHDCTLDIPFEDLGASDPTDGCTPDDELEIEIVICDFGNLNSLKDTMFNVPLDSFLVKVDVSDRCHANTTSDSILVILLDTLPPQPICRGPFDLNLPDSNGVKLAATYFDVNSYDACTPVSIDVRRMEENTFQDSVCFNCEDVGNEVMVVVRFTDDFGNSSICMVPVNVTDTLTVCPPDAFVISGILTYENNEPIANNPIHVFGQSNFTVQTDNAGRFVVEDIENEETVFLIPEKDDNHTLGLSTYDIILMQKHILGLQNLDSPYKIIAADVNNNGRVNASDLFEMRRVLLADMDEFPSNTSYVFVPSDLQFDDPGDPWASGEIFGHKISRSEPDHTVDFMGIKVGDVNKSLYNGTTRNTKIQEWTYELQQVAEFIEIPFYSAQKYCLGFQTSLHFNAESFDFHSIVRGQLDLSDAHIGRAKLNEGIIPISWNTTDEMEIDPSEPLFTLRFYARTNTLDVRLDQSNEPINSEVYLTHDDLSRLLIREDLKGGSDLILHNNVPNPWSGETQIRFSHNQKGIVSLDVYDAALRKVMTTERLFNEGENRITLTKNDLKTGGLYFYELRSEGQSQFGKMIVID